MPLIYKVKSNMRHPEVVALAAAVVDGSQPAIESLSNQFRKFMKNGVTAAREGNA